MKIVMGIIFCLTGVLLTGISHAEEPIPYKDFIAITEQALDVLDEVEAVFGRSDITKMEARTVLNRFSAALKKYKRYIPGRWPSGEQSEITKQFSMAEFICSISLTAGSFSYEDRTKLAGYAQKARELFIKYKSQKREV